MKRWFKFLTILLILLSTVAFAADITKQATISLEMQDTTNLKEWKLLMADTSGGETLSSAVLTIAYEGGSGAFSKQESIPISGSQGTHVVKYFTMVACGDVPQEEGGTQYMCSAQSNEVSVDFWIPAGQFSVPLTFDITVIN